MKELYKSITNILLADIELKTMLNYSATKHNIRRGYMPEGDWDKLLIYYFQPDTSITDFTSKIRQVPLIIRVYDREDDLNVSDIAERVVLLLDDADLSVPDELKSFNCSYTGALIPVSWNKDHKSYEKVIRFMVVFRLDNP